MVTVLFGWVLTEWIPLFLKSSLRSPWNTPALDEKMILEIPQNEIGANSNIKQNSGY